jgi:hypothetical protein
MTPRRLLTLIRSLPRATALSPGAVLWHVLDAEFEQSLTSAERIRARQALYAKKGGSGD